LNELSNDLHDLVNRLVSLHGEMGLCPTKSDWEAILSCPAEKPVNILNLLKFKMEVQTPAGPTSGFAAYGNYSTGVGGAFTRVGGKTLYFGKVNHIFGTVAGTDWDAAILTRYPTPRALANFWLDEEFIAAHAHRESGVDKSRVLVMSALREA
jgi:uncharacterized protein (DUF1330 family)